MNYEDQKKFDELNKNWLEAIKDWKGIIAEKDKRIEELEFEKRNLFGLIEKVSSKGQQQIRKQVCEEIKKEIEKLLEVNNSAWNDSEEQFRAITLYGLKNILERVEKGEI